jgi:hypothetical protein
MSVIINDFEVLVEPPEQPPVAAPETVESNPAPTLTPQDIYAVMRQQAQRRARLQAH